MTETLVERLRRSEPTICGSLHNKAADEIERLQERERDAKQLAADNFERAKKAEAEVARLSIWEKSAKEALAWSFRELKVMLDNGEKVNDALDRLTQRAEAVSAANERVGQALRGEKIG